MIACLLAACSSPSTSGLPAGFDVRFHPDGLLYAGDQVSVEVVASGAFKPDGHEVRITLDGQTLGQAGFSPYGIGQRMQGTLWWIWDTRGLQPEPYRPTFTVLPDGPTWQETITLHPQSGVPPPEPQAQWASVTSTCCLIYFITGTDAAGDISTLSILADTQAEDVSARFGADFQETITVTFLPRTLGHGGFTSDGIYVSYLDANYAGSTTAQVLHHEMVHWLDARLGGELRPTLLVEGLAVYLSGGHFKTETLLPRAAALLDLGWYIPLEKLTNDFYLQQHEIGYLEAGALVEYLVENYGWEKFSAYYRDIHADPDAKQSSAMDAALEKHFSLSLAELDGKFQEFLKNQTVTNDIRTDLHLTVQFYDTVRRYQQLLDPSAYFLTAWLPDGASMRARGIVADFLRHPHGFGNRVSESLLVEADRDLRAGEYMQVERKLKIVNGILDILE